MSQAETAVRAIAARLEAQALSAARAIVGLSSGRLERRIDHLRRSAAAFVSTLCSAPDSSSHSIAESSPPAVVSARGASCLAAFDASRPSAAGSSRSFAADASGRSAAAGSLSFGTGSRVRIGRISVSARALTRSSWLARITRWEAAASAIMSMTMPALSASRWAVGSSRTSTSAPSPRRCSTRTSASRRCCPGLSAAVAVSGSVGSPAAASARSACRPSSPKSSSSAPMAAANMRGVCGT